MSTSSTTHSELERCNATLTDALSRERFLRALAENSLRRANLPVPSEQPELDSLVKALASDAAKLAGEKP